MIRTRRAPGGINHGCERGSVQVIVSHSFKDGRLRRLKTGSPSNVIRNAPRGKEINSKFLDDKLYSAASEVWNDTFLPLKNTASEFPSHCYRADGHDRL